MANDKNPQNPQGGVIVVGGISIDLVAFMDRHPAPGESLLGDDFKIILGGKGSNQAVAAALAGCHSTMVSCVGTDLFTDFATDALASESDIFCNCDSDAFC